MKSGRFVGKSKAEEIVLNYLLKNTPKNYSKFNPTKLEATEIANNTDLDLKDVKEALTKLSEGEPRVEETSANFQFWLPCDEDGQRIGNKLHQNNLVQSNLFLFSFIGVVILYYLIIWAVKNGNLNLKTAGDFFFTGAIAIWLSILMAKWLSNKFYILNERIKNVKHYRIYVWLFVLFTTVIVYLWNSGIDKTPIAGKIIFYSSILANIITITVFIASLIKKR